MMAKVPCYLTITDLWEYDIDLDADAFPLLAICLLAMSGRDDHHVLFNLYVLRLDGNKDYKRAVAIENLAGK
jgi:hypothetical protein